MRSAEEKNFQCFNFGTIAVGLALYALNRFYLKNIVRTPVVSYLLNCHFNDFCGGICIIAYMNIVLSFDQHCPFRFKRYRDIFLACFICGLLWEYLFPLVFPRGTADPWDIVAYCLGGSIYTVALWLFNISNNTRTHQEV